MSKTSNKNRKTLAQWIWAGAAVGAMCLDQFVLDLPFLNVVFPILVVMAVELGGAVNLAAVAVWSVLFELSCLAWIPSSLAQAPMWLAEVFVGYMMPFALVKIFCRKTAPGTLAMSAIAAAGELLYFWVSVAATVVIWGVPPAAYIMNDLPFEVVGVFATFLCALPVCGIYRLLKRAGRRKRAALPLGEKA